MYLICTHQQGAVGFRKISPSRNALMDVLGNKLKTKGEGYEKTIP